MKTDRLSGGRKIIHVDMDAFYVSVELRDQPQLKQQPVAVGGSRQTRGVLSTCNYPARQYGIHSAMSTANALKLCPQLVVLPGRMALYKQVSLQIRDILARYTALIEPVSLDEAYLDVSDCRMFNGSATLIAHDICKTIAAELQLTASAGVAPIKYLAKVASDINKPNGVFVIAPKHVQRFIQQMPLKKIPGVGKVAEKKLLAAKLQYGRDIQASHLAFLLQRFGKFGCLLWERCHGIDLRPVQTNRQRKSLAVERTFEQDIDQLEQLNTELESRLIPELQRRAHALLATHRISKLVIKVKFADFQQTSHQTVVNCLQPELAKQLLAAALKRGAGKKVRLLGVQLGLQPLFQQCQQLSLDW